MKYTLAATLAILIPIADTSTTSAETRVILPIEAANCIKAHIDDYLSINNDPITIFPNHCPAIKISEITNLTTNCKTCPGETRGLTMLLVTKKQLKCFEKIDVNKDGTVFPPDETKC